MPSYDVKLYCRLSFIFHYIHYFKMVGSMNIVALYICLSDAVLGKSQHFTFQFARSIASRQVVRFLMKDDNQKRLLGTTHKGKIGCGD